MSAIIAGKACKKCGCEYMLSLGHPKWFDDVVKRKQPETVHYQAFDHLRRSGLCPACWLGWLGNTAEEAEKVSQGEKYEGWMPFAFMILNTLESIGGIKK